MTKIDKDIPSPAAPGYASRVPPRSRYPFIHMEVGESVFFPGVHRYDNKHIAYASAKALERRSERKFTMRADIDNDVKGIRIWRVA
jgi:hypothetical protein